MSSPMKIITIDGPAGAGKSTAARRLAKILNLSYLDTGAMYRALTLKALRKKIPLEDEAKLLELAEATTIDLKDHPNGMKVLLDGEDVSEEIRSLEVTNNTFYIARSPRVREVMVKWQREIGKQKGVVAEGRDLGTVVFPHAAKKFYLDADLVERSRRRIKELEAKGNHVNDQKLLEELKERDRKDMTRKSGPLKQAEDAIFINSTNLSIDGVVKEMLKQINSESVSIGSGRFGVKK